MSEESQQTDITRATVVYEVPGMGDVQVRRDVAYAEDEALTMDLYLPADADRTAPRPAVVIVSGFPDSGYEKLLGCRFKETGASVSWSRLLAASGLVAVTYSNREPVADLGRLLVHLSEEASSLGIDGDRIGIWASSGNVPNALFALMGEAAETIRCAALCYGFMIDGEGRTGVADAAAQWRFANPCEGCSVEDLPGKLPLLVVRAGEDQMPGLNDSIDSFVTDALAQNLPVTLVNHATGSHAFDLSDDSKASRESVRVIVRFLRSGLVVP